MWNQASSSYFPTNKSNFISALILIMGYMTGADSGEAEREKTGQRVAKVVGKVIEAKGLVLPKLAGGFKAL